MLWLDRLPESGPVGPTARALQWRKITTSQEPLMEEGIRKTNYDSNKNGKHKTQHVLKCRFSSPPKTMKLNVKVLN